jgi:serine/threonine-protein kinase
MKTYFGRPDEHPLAVRPTGMPASQTAAELFKRGRDTVLAPPPSRVRPPGAPPAVLPPLTAEQHVLLRLVDGRLSIARLARLAGLSEDAAAQALSALCAQNVLVLVEPTEVTIHGQSGSPFYKLGQYEIAARVGQGGMGSVYVCRRIGAAGFRRLFALKVVRQNSGQEDAACRAFVREMSVGRLLTHPNVQSVVDVGTYSDQPYLVLDYVEGTDLEELMSTGGPVAPGVLLTVLADVLRGLQAAHELLNDDGTPLGLVHGDVSPPNILIGLDGVARLADFGNVRFSARGETGHNEAYVVGKPAFMAPEHFRGQPTDRRSDLFSVGVVMWNALTGRELFAADTYEQVVRNVLEKELVPPSTFGAPQCLDEVCMRALSREPRWRYGTADELAEDLLRLAVQNGLRATPTQVSAYVRTQLGATVDQARQRIEQGFRGVRTDAAVPVAAPSPDSVRIPAVSRRSAEPTVVLPQSRLGAITATPRATAVRAAPRQQPWRSELQRAVVIALGIALGAIAFIVAVRLTNRANGSAHQRRPSTLRADASVAATPQPPASHP